MSGLEDSYTNNQGRLSGREDSYTNNQGRLSGRQRRSLDRIPVVKVNYPAHLRFDGKGSWQVFKRHFEDHLQAVGWNNREALAQLDVALIGVAQEFFTTNLVGSSDLCYDMAMAALEERFDPVDGAARAEAEFDLVDQRENESVDAWATRVRALGEKAFRKSDAQYRESRITRKFCRGLRDKGAATQVLFMELEELQPAKVKVKAYLNAKALAGKEKKGVCTIRPRDEIVEETESKEGAGRINVVTSGDASKIDTLMKMVNDLSTEVSKWKTGACFRCGDEGHLARDCPRNTSMGRGGRGRGRGQNLGGRGRGRTWYSQGGNNSRSPQDTWDSPGNSDPRNSPQNTAGPRNIVIPENVFRQLLQVNFQQGNSAGAGGAQLTPYVENGGTQPFFGSGQGTQ